MIKPPAYYSIRSDYIQRDQIVYCRQFKRQSKRRPIKQPFVYDIAGEIAKEQSASYIVDIGCGNGYKLIQYRDQYHIIGIDHGQNVNFCRERYPFGEWINFDLELPLYLKLNKRGGVGIVADVVEHLLDPDNILGTIREWLINGTCKAVVLSTPERLLTYSGDHIGPPVNINHIREWSFSEFEGYLNKIGIPIAAKGLTCDRDDLSFRHHVDEFTYSYPRGYGRLPPFRTIFMVLSHLNIKLSNDGIRWILKK